MKARVEGDVPGDCFELDTIDPRVFLLIIINGIICFIECEYKEQDFLDQRKWCLSFCSAWEQRCIQLILKCTCTNIFGMNSEEWERIINLPRGRQSAPRICSTDTFHGAKEVRVASGCSQDRAVQTVRSTSCYKRRCALQLCRWSKWNTFL